MKVVPLNSASGAPLDTSAGVRPSSPWWTLGGTYSQAYAVNNLGQVVGYANTVGDAEEHAFLWTQAGGMVDLGTLGGTGSLARAVNNSGLVAGEGGDASGETHAVVWQCP